MTLHVRTFTLALCISLALAVSLAAQDEPVTEPQPQQEQERQPAIGGGYEESFNFLRDVVAFRAYAGVLKGAEGTLADSAGNSLDRALLLSKLLQERGYKPAIAQGRLSGEALERVIALSQGLHPDPETGALPQLNPASHEDLALLLSDHYWVQIPAAEETWIDLDPTLPDNLPGRTIADFRKRLLRLPSHLFQLIEIGVWAEFSVGGQPVRSRLLRWVKSIPGVGVKPIVLFFVRREADGRFVYSENNRWYPVLWYDGTIQPALNLESEANRLAVRARGVVKPPEVRRIWMDITVHAPSQDDIATHRTLYSADQPNGSRLGEMQVFRVGTNPPTSEYLNAAASALELSAAAAAAVKPTDYPQVLSDTERGNIATLADTGRDLSAAIATLYEKALAQRRSCVSEAFLSLPGILRPHLFSVATAPATGSVMIDLVDLEEPAATISPRDLQAVAAGFAFGVAASQLEGDLLGRFGEGVAAESSLTLTRAYAQRGATWRAYDIRLVNALDQVEWLDDLLLARMDEAIRAGKIIILPNRQEGLPLVWWEIDGDSGTAIGMIEPGIGGARLATQDTEDWAYVASSFAPLFEPTWPKRLADYCRVAAAALRAQDSPAPAPDLAQAVQDVYDLVYTSFAADPDVLIAPGVREFFSPSGRILLREMMGSLCGEKAALPPGS